VGVSDRTRPPHLTPIERKILTFVLEGLSSQEIADRTHRSDGRVRTIISDLLRKFGVPSRSALVSVAFVYALADEILERHGLMLVEIPRAYRERLTR
jgi:DNA-binding NarL/FixJ family response regulator